MKDTDLLDAILLALDMHGLSRTKFGYVVAGDPALVGKMEKGRRLRPPLRKKVTEALERLNKDGTL